MTETATALAPARRGRPRPQLTIERDKAVAAKMAEFSLDQEWTVEEVAQAVGLDTKIVYHCLNRLSWSEVVTKVGRGKFRRTDKPYTTEYSAKPERAPAAPTDAEAPVE